MAVLSDIAICNMALSHLGRTSGAIQSFGEKSTEGRLCTVWYDQCRREVLEAHDWSFARGRIALALHNDAPPPDWAYRYQTPSDMVAVRSIWNPFNNGTTIFGNPAIFPAADLSNATAFDLETSVDGQQVTLLSNVANATLLYTRDMTLVQMFSPLFTNALSHYLAAKMAFGVTGKPMIEDKESKAFQVAMRTATASDANQQVQQPIRDAYAVRARQ